MGKKSCANGHVYLLLSKEEKKALALQVEGSGSMLSLGSQV